MWHVEYGKSTVVKLGKNDFMTLIKVSDGILNTTPYQTNFILRLTEQLSQQKSFRGIVNYPFDL